MEINTGAIFTGVIFLLAGHGLNHLVTPTKKDGTPDERYNPGCLIGFIMELVGVAMIVMGCTGRM